MACRGKLSGTLVAVPLAHETWFTDRIPDTDWGFLTETRTLVYLAVAVGITLALRLIARRWDGFPAPFLARLVPWMPFAVRIHLAVSLIGMLSGGWYLAPAMELDGSLFDWLLGISMAVTAFFFVTGWHTRTAALALVALGPLGMIEFGFWDVLQRADMLGLALFLAIAGPGRWSADFELGRERDPVELDAGRAVWALRLAAGTALIAVALYEKLANPDLALHFLEEEGAQQSVNFNVPEALGFPVTDIEFIRLAGAIEVLIGLLVISGALPQVIVLLAGIPFNLTLYFFGTIELLGHLPIYGTMLVLLVYGSDPRLRPWCSRLWPWGRPAARAAPAAGAA
jgi:hypothetical protein